MKYTKDSLKNTWGVVESKEHAEFIIELAESHGLGFYDDDESRMFFTFNEDSKLFFYCSAVDVLNKSRCKQITIPLPPKDKEEERISYTIKKGIQAKKGCEDFELTGVDSIGCAATVSVSFNDSDEIINIECENLPPKDKAEKTDFSKPPKHFDCVCNKCGGKCCIGNCDEWPKVGDEVLFTPNPTLNRKVKCLVSFIGDKYIVLVGRNGREYSKRKAKAIIEKPKSKQDLLIEDLYQKLLTNNCKDYYLLACDIVQGKINGLSYE